MNFSFLERFLYIIVNPTKHIVVTQIKERLQKIEQLILSIPEIAEREKVLLEKELRLAERERLLDERERMMVKSAHCITPSAMAVIRAIMTQSSGMDRS